VPCARVPLAAGRPSIRVFDQSDASKLFCCGCGFLAQRSVVTCSAPAAMIFLLVTSFACSAALAAESKRVMLLHSFGRDFKPWSEYAKSIRTELSRQSPWRWRSSSIRFSQPASAMKTRRLRLSTIFRALFAKHPLDLIVSSARPRQTLCSGTGATFCHHPDGAAGSRSTSSAVF